MKLLLVEDDDTIRSSIREILEGINLSIDEAKHGTAAWEMIEYTAYDLLMLDINLPGIDGLEICRRVRKRLENQPMILMLTARDTSQDMIAGLDLGADDYIVKPFDPRVLIARTKALMRRANKSLHEDSIWGQLSITKDGSNASFGGEQLQLTQLEHRLLEELTSHQGKTRSKEQLINAAWAWSSSPGEETVKTHIKNIRNKLEKAGAPKDFIETAYGIGFRMNPNYA